MARILVTRPVAEPALEMLRNAFGADAIDLYEEDAIIPREELLRRVAGKDGVFALLSEKVDAEFLEAAGPGLRIVANMAVGYDNITVPECSQRGVAVTNTPDVLTETTADLAWGLIIGASRRFAEAERFLRNGEWKEWSPTLLCGVDVYGKTLGILGMGRIGQAVARRATGFGMRVIYHNRSRLPEDTERALNAERVDLPTLLAESDILSVHCPLGDATHGILGAEAFKAMKPTAVLVNTSRGPVVDETALAEALLAKEIFAAGLDVFEREPSVHARLLECDNVVLLPHLGSATYATRQRMAETAAANLVAFFSGKRPPNCVNPEVLQGG
ncbi:MAG: D-glycerate dehydrogenase [Candidatus Hydrogenedens sp.]|nr:D-glycerate dehydrogenase [Candidatus Hydrogenedens sp.]